MELKIFLVGDACPHPAVLLTAGSKVSKNPARGYQNFFALHYRNERASGTQATQKVSLVTVFGLVLSNDSLISALPCKSFARARKYANYVFAQCSRVRDIKDFAFDDVRLVKITRIDEALLEEVKRLA